MHDRAKKDGLIATLDSNRSKWYRCAPVERKQIAHLKRLLECYVGDPDFRRRLHENPHVTEELMRSRGIELDPQVVSTLWTDGPPSYKLPEKLKDHRLFKLYADILEGRGEETRLLALAVNAAISVDRFTAWHSRQIARCTTELGYHRIPHIVLAFELTKGCSQACWFCGVAARELQGVFDYSPENKALWRELLTICREEIGTACLCGICYCATEPMDNPHYFSFIKDFRRILGYAPMTTTAAGVKNLERTRELLEYYNREDPLGLRLSITTLNDLHKLHEMFSAEELSLVRLALQNKGTLFPKSPCGKFRYHEKKNPADDSISENISVLATIACLTGFLVNMVDRSIQLVSPCQATDRWPLGYRIFWEGQFSDGKDFRTCIRQAIDETMTVSIPPDRRISFRGDLKYETLENGFRLANRYRRVSLRANDAFKPIGELIHQGDMTISEIMATVTSQGVNLFNGLAQLNLLFENGFLEEDVAIET